jgi:DNA polymerase III delta subunit
VGTYTQWDKSRKLAKVIWVYGPESALVQEVTGFVRSSVSASGMDRFAYDAAVNTEAEIWDSVYSRSLSDSSSRLIEVSGADKLKSVDRLLEWISTYSKHSPETTLLLTSVEEPTAPGIKAPKVTVIKCVMHRPEDKLAWTIRTGNFSESTAKRLLEYKNGDLEETYGICQKIRALLPDQAGVELSLETLQSLDEETPQGFVEALVERDKPRAFAAISSVSGERVGGILSQLDYTLSLVDRLRDVFSETPRGQKLDSISGFPMSRFSEVAPAARTYTFQDLVRCRQILTLLESYHRQGISDGLLEALVSLW